MREIKFRVYCSYRKQMFTNEGIDSHASFNENGTISTHGVFGENPLMQYTGLKDKNGVDIYEGDIVKATHRTRQTAHIGNIQMPKSCWVLQITNDIGNFRWYRTAEYSELEIIGNIHQTPELL